LLPGAFVKDARSAKTPTPTFPLHHIPHHTRSQPPCPAPAQKISLGFAPNKTPTLRFSCDRQPRSFFPSPQSPAMADATNTNDELYPIAVLIDELKVWR
jgi:hypothetical protein